MQNEFSELERNSRIILTLSRRAKSFSKAVFMSLYYHSYFSVTTPPAASSLALSSSAVFLSTPSLTIIGALVGHIFGFHEPQSELLLKL